MAYTVRSVYRIGEARSGAPARVRITSPKEKSSRAVGGVLLRLRTREAYRLNRAWLVPALAEAGKSVDVAFIYLSKSPADYAVIEEKMRVVLEKIQKAATDE